MGWKKQQKKLTGMGKNNKSTCWFVYLPVSWLNLRSRFSRPTSPPSSGGIEATRTTRAKTGRRRELRQGDDEGQKRTKRNTKKGESLHLGHVVNTDNTPPATNFRADFLQHKGKKRATPEVAVIGPHDFRTTGRAAEEFSTRICNQSLLRVLIYELYIQPVGLSTVSMSSKQRFVKVKAELFVRNGALLK